MSNLSRVYAGALFELAQENNQEAIIADQLKTLNEAFDATIYEYMDSIELTINDKKTIMGSVLTDQVDLLVVHFIDVLLDNHRFFAFSLMVNDYLKLYRVQNKISIASVVSPRPLDKDALEKIKSALEHHSGHTVELDCTIDTDLIAGFTIEMDGSFMDYSLANRLNMLKTQLKKGERL